MHLFQVGPPLLSRPSRAMIPFLRVHHNECFIFNQNGRNHKGVFDRPSTTYRCIALCRSLPQSWELSFSQSSVSAWTTNSFLGSTFYRRTSASVFVSRYRSQHKEFRCMFDISVGLSGFDYESVFCNSTDSCWAVLP